MFQKIILRFKRIKYDIAINNFYFLDQCFLSKNFKNKNITCVIKNPFGCNLLRPPFLRFSRNKSSNLNKQIPLGAVLTYLCH